MRHPPLRTRLDPVLKDSFFAPLEGLAVASFHGNAVQSRGLCLHASVEFCREARRRGMGRELFLVRWLVRGDLDFLEHWAVASKNGRILDMTAAQVDGDPRPVRRPDE